MARGHGRGRRRRSFNLRRVRVAASLAVGALDPSDVISGTITNVTPSPLRIISAHLTFGLSDLGATADDGQEFGIAHSDYTAAEIEECLEAAGSIDLGDKVSQERANRLVRSVGQMTGAPGTGAGLSWNDGRPVKLKLNWVLTVQDSLVAWVRNASGTVYTTGASLDVFGSLWVRDSV